MLRADYGGYGGYEGGYSARSAPRGKGTATPYRKTLDCSIHIYYIDYQTRTRFQ